MTRLVGISGWIAGTGLAICVAVKAYIGLMRPVAVATIGWRIRESITAIRLLWGIIGAIAIGA